MNKLSVKRGMTFKGLVVSIEQVHKYCIANAAKAVNVGLTLRNWIIGMYIFEYEQAGADRAKYGSRIIEKLAVTLHKKIDCCYTDRYLRLCRQFYETYPQIRKSLTAKSGILQIRKSAISELPVYCPGTTKKQFDVSVPAEKLVEKLSFTHFIEFLKCADSVSRAFYEYECVRGNWSVRELKRQISTLYFERSGLSKNKKKLAALISKKAETNKPEFTIHDPYVFEFLGLKSKETVSESYLESALLERLQDFLLELGYGFCFEAKQQRINIGGEYCFIDLVFYHRILKCHVLIELKVDGFKHEYIGQLNTYVNWYKKHAMVEGDNPPVGILLCTHKNQAMVEYALAGMDNKLFVKKYQLELPKKKDIQKFLKSQMKG